MAFVTALLNALAAIPAIEAEVDEVVQAIITWWVARQNTATLALVADAAALASRAQTSEDRLNADIAWKTALSQPRITAS
jgi:hypothetical protein